MTVDVDPVAKQVRVGERCWPFSLDCRRNAVSAELGGASYCLRPLRWSEKRNLARYTHLGEAFLVREFVRLCLEPKAELPREDDEFAALAALARWINAPNEKQRALPLDEGLLTRGAFAVAAAYGWTPDKLDGLNCFEVELLWAGEEQLAHEDADAPAPEAASGQQRTAATAPHAPPRVPPTRLAPPAPDMNRILIVPDAAPTSSPLAGEATEEAAPAAEAAHAATSAAAEVPSTASTPSRSGEHARMPERPADADPSSAVARKQRTAVARERRRIGFGQIRVKMHGSVPPIAPPDAVLGDRRPPSTTSEQAAPPVAIAAARAAGIPPAAASAIGPLRAAMPESPPPLGARHFARATSSPRRDARPAARVRTDAEWSPPRQGATRANPPSPPAHSLQAPSLPPMVPFAADPPTVMPIAAEAPFFPAKSGDDLFLQWAERLEQAAEELGIRLED